MKRPDAPPVDVSQPGIATPDVELIEGHHINKETVHIDGKHFRSCHFTECTFVFSATNGYQFEDCVITGGAFRIEGLANATMRFIELAYSMSSATVQDIEKFVERLKQAKQQIPEYAGDKLPPPVFPDDFYR